LTPEAKADVAVRVHQSTTSWNPRAVRRVYIPKASNRAKMPATSAVFLIELIELIGTRFVAVIRMVVVMLVSLAVLMSYRGSLVGTRAGRVRVRAPSLVLS
jgi:hypothetical protein